MCLAIPGKIIEKNNEMAKVEIGGVVRDVSMMLVPEAQVGDYVLVHTGFAIEKIDEKEACITLALFKELTADEIY